MKMPKRPLGSGEYITCPRTITKVMATKVFIHEESFQDKTEFLEDMQDSGYDTKGWKVQSWGYSNTIFTLAEILSLVEPGMPPEQVSVVSERPRDCHWHKVSLIHQRPITEEEKTAWELGKRVEQEEFAIKQTAYLQQKKKYDAWLLSKEIKKKQRELEWMMDKKKKSLTP